LNYTAASGLAKMWRLGGLAAWVALADPTSALAVPQGGSVWPIVGDSYVTARSAPVGFVTVAVGATASAQWLPGTANFKNMVDTYNAASGQGEVKGVLWWQGESDANNSVSEATYHANLAAIADAVHEKWGVKLFVAKLQKCSSILPSSRVDAINAAITAAWSDVASVAPGPDLSDLDADDGLHLKSDANIQTAASRWWTAIAAEFGW